MSWTQLLLTVEKQCAPQIELLMERLGALSVTLDDAADEALLEPAPGESPLWQKTRITGLFAKETDQAWLRSKIDQLLGNEISRQIKLEPLEDRQWERAWLDDFRPMKFGRNLWICPDGQRPGRTSGTFIDLDPGLAFGTGTHPTTALCLNWLDRQQLSGSRLMDFGCGSGILSVAALKLGASEVIAVDHDPQALEATRCNGEKNSVLSRLRVFHSESVPAVEVDLIVANILAGTLIDLEATLASAIRPGGRIILSGILSDQTASVSAAYTADFELSSPITLENWVLLEGRRR
jgi:ribosomal protein L11 methyltransferase